MGLGRAHLRNFHVAHARRTAEAEQRAREQERPNGAPAPEEPPPRAEGDESGTDAAKEQRTARLTTSGATGGPDQPPGPGSKSRARSRRSALVHPGGIPTRTKDGS